MKEVEIRSFLIDQQYDDLLAFFHENANYLGDDVQETQYLDTKEDVRLQINKSGGKIVHKKGKVHDLAREETEVHLASEQVENLKKIFDLIGLRAAIVWFRKRHTFQWDKIVVTIDDTKGYGKIIELEIASDEAGLGASTRILQKKLAELGIAPTPREEFERRFTHYKNHWETLLRSP